MKGLFGKKKQVEVEGQQEEIRDDQQHDGEPTGLEVDEQELLKHHGLQGLLRIGLNAAKERKEKNRIIACLIVFIGLLCIAVAGLAFREVEPVVLSETADGRIRPLPLLSNPIYSEKEIMAWSERCVRDIYDLSYVNWRTQISNNTYCLSDTARAGFVDALRKIGLLNDLTEQNLGIVYAVPERAVIRPPARNSNQPQYAQWIIDVPYTIHVVGKKPRRLSAVMTLLVQRVPMTKRESGVWVDRYQIRSRN